MTEKQKKQVTIQKSVMAVMEKNLPKWEKVPQLKNNYDLFVKNIKKIDDCLADMALDPTPLQEKKSKVRDELITRTFPVVSALSVFAEDCGDKKMAKRTAIRELELKNLKNGELKKYVRYILNKTAPPSDPAKSKKKAKAPAISGYGISEDHIHSIDSSLQLFVSVEKELQDTLTRKKEATVELDQRIRANRKLMKTKLDRLMHLFREKDRSFFEAYFIAHVETDAPQKESAPKAKPASKTSPGSEKKPAGTGTRKATAASTHPAGQQKRTAAAKSPAKSTPGKRPAK